MHIEAPGRDNPSRDRLRLHLQATPACVGEARRRAADFAESAGFDGWAVRTAVSELVTNAVLHGYAQSTGELDVNADLDRNDLLVTVADQGEGMTPHPDRAGMGIGLAMAGSLASSVEISHGHPRGTVVKLRFGRG
ncbi:MAG: serine/threonine-protein kinase RsbW [Solirubrobacterales bacterium]|jgi:stage II sporulation protein AB (anti-sigma F factor)|nr:serine/threonine-protein kinase RsbW [Solirubrobacterales bacterium]